MTKTKKSSAKASSAKLSPAQKAANTREAKKREIANEILRLSDENHKLKDEKSHLAAQLFDLKNKKEEKKEIITTGKSGEILSKLHAIDKAEIDVLAQIKKEREELLFEKEKYVNFLQKELKNINQ